MTELRVSEAVCQAFPRLRIAAVVARGFGGHEPWPEADVELAALEKAAGDGHTLPADESDPHIAAWYAAYRAFGTNPKTRAAERGRTAAAGCPDRPATADQRRGGLLQSRLGQPWYPGGRVRPGRGAR
jgi:hypothetical protein